jgi:signal peptidase I
MISSGYHFFYVQGNSMAPTLSDGDTVLIKKDNDLAKSQVVVFRFPEQWENPFNEDSLLIKRVIAVEGDTFSYSGRVFTVNGKKYPLPDNYNCKTEKTTYTKTLGKNEMIVFGDNVSQSADSRFFYCRDNTEGFIVSTDLIVSSGRIVFDF